MRISSRLCVRGPHHEVGTRHPRALPLITDLSPNKEAVTLAVHYVVAEMIGAVPSVVFQQIAARLSDGPVYVDRMRSAQRARKTSTGWLPSLPSPTRRSRNSMAVSCQYRAHSD
jgi:hypothetical protein